MYRKKKNFEYSLIKTSLKKQHSFLFIEENGEKKKSITTYHSRLFMYQKYKTPLTIKYQCGIFSIYQNATKAFKHNSSYIFIQTLH